jgi:hypothetical protein
VGGIGEHSVEFEVFQDHAATGESGKFRTPQLLARQTLSRKNDFTRWLTRVSSDWRDKPRGRRVYPMSKIVVAFRRECFSKGLSPAGTEVNTMQD